ncbi:MAG: rod shape-determining protein RodA [Actinomycetota bacterium]|nr:rod shape-determining protein RodA [Actinomycetota bacterium]
MTIAVRSQASVDSLDRDPGAPHRHVDYSLMLLVAVIVTFGLVMVWSATKASGEDVAAGFVQRQLVAIAVGIALASVAVVVDYRRLRPFAPVLYLLSLALLGLVLVMGEENNGAQAWFSLGSFTFQPSEPAKLALIVTLAAFLSDDRSKRDEKPNEIVRLVGALAIAAVPMALILLQPDLGTMLVFVAVGAAMLVVSGIRPLHLFLIALAGFIAVAGLLSSGVLKEYQRDRLTVFISPDDAAGDIRYNAEQSQIAVGTGGMLGQGLGEGPQTQNGFVPEQQTDFIFTAVGEELGFVGGGLLLGAFLLLALRVLRAAQMASDAFGALLCTGVLALIVFQVFQNVGMSLGIMPITGIPLPLVSYGGSSTISLFIALGLVLNVHMRRYI